MKKFFVFLLSLVALLIVVAAGLGLYVRQALQPVSSDTTEMRFVVTRGQAISNIASNLQEAGLIHSGQIFSWYVRLNKIDKKIQAGSFTLSASQSFLEIAQALTEGTEDVWITLLEGWRVEETADYLEKSELDTFNKADFLELSATSEGYLFPDTYLVPREITAEALYNLFTRTFENKVATEFGDLDQADLKRLVILASLVEREARGFTQMRHVAGILENRLEIGMALQVDATLQYIRGEVNGKWWSPPRSEDKKLSSPYNTYENPGLPPYPIANPGLDALKAAYDPLQVDDLYYLHAPSGEIYFGETLEEHNQNISKYLR
ncbi:MAG: endolytic transglycosylase MltG [Candidatus Pacebacteria bacterium CG_4_10_14_0_8_um_filter_42_14]|nr:MAG: endolytic transglycosylase MltG [Candidatus Pacebacteria bacterium CG_4_10_14_0_8_um_filter_42_14]